MPANLARQKRDPSACADVSPEEELTILGNSVLTNSGYFGHGLGKHCIAEETIAAEQCFYLAVLKEIEAFADITILGW